MPAGGRASSKRPLGRHICGGTSPQSPPDCNSPSHGLLGPSPGCPLIEMPLPAHPPNHPCAPRRLSLATGASCTFLHPPTHPCGPRASTHPPMWAPVQLLHQCRLGTHHPCAPCAALAPAASAAHSSGCCCRRGRGATQLLSWAQGPSARARAAMKIAAAASGEGMGDPGISCQALGPAPPRPTPTRQTLPNVGTHAPTTDHPRQPPHLPHSPPSPTSCHSLPPPPTSCHPLPPPLPSRNPLHLLDPPPPIALPFHHLLHSHHPPPHLLHSPPSTHTHLYRNSSISGCVVTSTASVVPGYSPVSSPRRVATVRW